jgi:Mn-containing catalase
MPPMPEFASTYFKMSHGGEAVNGPWNSGTGLSVENGEPAVDGGDGNAWVELEADEQTSLTEMATRLQSDPDSDPTTGAELGGTQTSEASTGGKRKR